MNLTFGEKIEDLRKENQLKSKELAKALGMVPQQLSDYENNKSVPLLETVLKFAKYFNVSVDYLCGNIPFKVDLSLLNTPFSGKHQILTGEMLERMTQLSDEDREKLADYLILLEKANHNRD